MYVQSYAAQENANAATRHPGDVEMRWQQFTAWTMGASFVDAFHVGSSSGSLFLNGNMNTPWQPRYDQFKETARQGRNLGPALTRLISYGYGPSIGIGVSAGHVRNSSSTASCIASKKPRIRSPFAAKPCGASPTSCVSARQNSPR